MKEHLYNYSYWDDNITKKLTYKGWIHVSKYFINKTVVSLPKQPNEVIDYEKKMISY